MDIWHNLAAWQWLAQFFVGNFVREGLYYLVVAALLWFLLHRLLRNRLSHRVIAGWPSKADVRREMGYSLATLVVFAAQGLLVFACIMRGNMVLYFDPQEYGYVWLAISFPVLLLWHDFYFYWTHRLLHTRWWFRRVHGVHHRSRNPSPWAAYAFHPVEAFINSLVTPLALWMMPVHGLVLLAFSIHQIVRNAHGHLAIETMPHGFNRHWLGGRFTTTTHHHLHHETARGNYGLWFTFWDRWMGTERSDYHTRFEQVTTPR